MAQHAQLQAQAMLENQSVMSPMSPGSGSSAKSVKSAKKKNGNVREMSPEGPVSEVEQFTGISCLLITWKSNPEVEHLKVLIK